MVAVLLTLGLSCMSALATTPAKFNVKRSQDQPVFKSEVEMVLVDVIVADKHGHAVPGLSAADFEITEDGHRQSIASLEEFQTVSVAGEIDLHGASAGSTTGRFFGIVVDDIHITPHPPAIVRARAAAASLVKAAAPGDQIMVVSPGAGLITIERIPEGRDRLVKLCESIEGLWEICNPAEMKRRKYWFLKTLALTLDKLSEVKGPKGLVVVSRGILYGSKSLIVDSSEYRQFTELSLFANAPLFFVNVGGLESARQADPRLKTSPGKFGERGLSSYMSDSYRSRAINIMDTLASDTGGFTIRNTNAPEKEMSRIVRESSVYYLIGYYPTKKERDGKFRKIKVKVKRKGLKVRARKGYYAPVDSEKE